MKRIKSRDIYSAFGVALLGFALALMAGCVSGDAGYQRDILR